MQAVFTAANAVVLLALGALTLHWPPAGFAFLLVLPLALLGFGSVFRAGVSARAIFVTTATSMSAGLAAAAWLWPPAVFGYALVVPLVLLGLADMAQTRQAVRRNFPVIGHARYLLETVRPELHQYFVESDTDGRPFSREERSLIYQRAKGAVDTLPFGTQRDLYRVGTEWINHSLRPVEVPDALPRIRVGAGVCARPYSTSSRG